MTLKCQQLALLKIHARFFKLFDFENAKENMSLGSDES